MAGAVQELLERQNGHPVGDSFALNGPPLGDENDESDDAGLVAPLVRLNLGAGTCPLPGYLNLDRKTGQEIYPLAFADGSVDEVRASHVLEHFSHRLTGAVLAEWVRVLKPGGLLKIAVPNFEWIARAYLAGESVDVQGFTMGSHSHADDHHGAIFDEEELTRAMRKHGCYDVRPWTSEQGDCAALPVSLNLQAKKKGPLPKWKIAGAMSVPRLGFQDNFFCWVNALLPLGIIPLKWDGTSGASASNG